MVLQIPNLFNQKLFTISPVDDDVLHYEGQKQLPGTSVSTWVIARATLFQTKTLAGNLTGIYFRKDGLKLYGVDLTGNTIMEYDLEVPWDISTATLLQTGDISVEETNARSVFISPDGLKVYVTGWIGDDLNEYDLSPAWDISTIAINQTVDFSGDVGANPYDAILKTDGTRMYLTGSGKICQYDLGTPWDISTAGAVTTKTGFDTPGAIFLRDDGLKLYVLGVGSGLVRSYNLGTAWDVSTAKYLRQIEVSVSGVVFAQGLSFKTDGTKMYVAETNTNIVKEYNLI